MEQISQNEVASCQDVPQRCTCCSLISSVQSVQFAEGLKVGAEIFVGFHFECVHLEVTGTCSDQFWTVASYFCYTKHVFVLIWLMVCYFTAKRTIVDCGSVPTPTWLLVLLVLFSLSLSQICEVVFEISC